MHITAVVFLVSVFEWETLEELSRHQRKMLFYIIGMLSADDKIRFLKGMYM